MPSTRQRIESAGQRDSPACNIALLGELSTMVSGTGLRFGGPFMLSDLSGTFHFGVANPPLPRMSLLWFAVSESRHQISGAQLAHKLLEIYNGPENQDKLHSLPDQAYRLNIQAKFARPWQTWLEWPGNPGVPAEISVFQLAVLVSSNMYSESEINRGPTETSDRFQDSITTVQLLLKLDDPDKVDVNLSVNGMSPLVAAIGSKSLSLVQTIISARQHDINLFG